MERTQKTRTKKERKTSGGMVDRRSQKVSEDKITELEIDIHRNPAQDENQARHGTEGDWIRRIKCEPNFADSDRSQL